MSAALNWMGNRQIFIELPFKSDFLIGAIEEEIIFFGYIQTRLTGIIRQDLLCSFCTALLFLAMHYPIHWGVGGFSLSSLSLYHVICLIILHFVCDFYIRKQIVYGELSYG